MKRRRYGETEPDEKTLAGNATEEGKERKKETNFAKEEMDQDRAE